jgi:hypothetical protein
MVTVITLARVIVGVTLVTILTPVTLVLVATLTVWRILHISAIA